MFGLVGKAPYIKVCGVTHTADVELCAQENVQMVGMVLTPGYVRSVDPAIALQLAALCRAVQIVPVYVFVQPEYNELFEKPPRSTWSRFDHENTEIKGFGLPFDV